VWDFIVCKELRRPEGVSAGLGEGILLGEDRIIQEPVRLPKESVLPLVCNKDIICDLGEYPQVLQYSGHPKILQTILRERELI